MKSEVLRGYAKNPLIYSEKGSRRDARTIRKHIAQERAEAEKRLRKLARRWHPSPEAAQAAVEAVGEEWKFHTFQVTDFTRQGKFNERGRPAVGQEPDSYEWRAVAGVIEKETAVQAELAKAGKFVLATNDLDGDRLPAERWLALYKGQNQTVERGFRFLKDPLFFAHSLFLKKPSRIMALLMIMGLCLLIYALAEHLLRTELVRRDETLPDQTGKPTQRITMRRVFQVFEGIDILIITPGDGPPQRVILNLTELQRKILEMLGSQVERYYLLP